MAYAAGALNTRFAVEFYNEQGGTDQWGDPIGAWVEVGRVNAEVRNETGIGAIRSGAVNDIPQSIARYSLGVRTASVVRYSIATPARMRDVRSGIVYSVLGVINDVKDRTRSYVVCEVGGNEG